MERPHDSINAITEILTLVPRGAESCAPGITSPVHEIEARGVLNHCTIDRPPVDEPSERMAITFSRASLPWDLQCGDEIRRSGDQSVYEITAVVPEGVCLVTAVVLPVRGWGCRESR